MNGVCATNLDSSLRCAAFRMTEKGRYVQNDKEGRCVQNDRDGTLWSDYKFCAARPFLAAVDGWFGAPLGGEEAHRLIYVFAEA